MILNLNCQIVGFNGSRSVFQFTLYAQSTFWFATFSPRFILVRSQHFIPSQVVFTLRLAAMLVDENKRFLISFFCPSTVPRDWLQTFYTDRAV